MSANNIAGSTKRIADRATYSATLLAEILENHPVRERNYVLPTSSLDRTYAVIRERVWARRTGVFFYGSPRLGKTTCAEEVQLRLKDEFPKIHVILLSARRPPRGSETHMYKLLLEAMKHRLASRNDTYALFSNVISEIMMGVGKRAGTHFVLIIDEIQLLSDNDLELLLVIHNALALARVKMTTISFAQPEIFQKIAALVTKQQTQILARFLAEPCSFEGCANKGALKVLLEGYDDKSEYPEDTGWSYTRFFLPLAYENGFRLSKFTGPIWDEIITATSLHTGETLPMEHVCLIIEDLLLNMRRDDCENFTLSTEEIKTYVEASGIANFVSQMRSSSDGE